MSQSDPVTEADREIESYIRERISEAYLTHGIIGEEHDDKMALAIARGSSIR